MKKLKLNLDDLKVESFETTPETEKRRPGTVYGFVPVFTEAESCLPVNCNDPGGSGTCETQNPGCATYPAGMCHNTYNPGDTCATCSCGGETP